MRIRFFNIVEPVAPLYRDLLPYLAGKGFQVEVIIGKTEYRPGRPPLEDVLLHENIRIVRVGGGFVAGKGKLAKLGAMLSYTWGAVRHTIFGKKVDLNFFLTQPPFFALWGNFLRRIRGEAYLCLVMDMYPDVAFQDGVIKGNSLVGSLLRSISQTIYRNAEAIVVIGRCMQERLISKGIAEKKIHLIPNWVNERDVFPIDDSRNSLRHELGLGDEFIVLYSGNLGASHYFDDLLEVARRCKYLAGLKFVIIGDGVRRKEIEKAESTFLLDNLLLLPFQPSERLAESLNLGDVHFVSLKEGFQGLEVPSKAYGSLAAGRALIYQGNPSGEIARMITEAGIGCVVQEGDVDGLERSILDYVKDRSQAKHQGERALELARTKNSSIVALQRYEALFLSKIYTNER